MKATADSADDTAGFRHYRLAELRRRQSEEQSFLQ